MYNSLRAEEGRNGVFKKENGQFHSAFNELSFAVRMQWKGRRTGGEHLYQGYRGQKIHA